jgi:hypothetical protein
MGVEFVMVILSGVFTWFLGVGGVAVVIVVVETPLLRSRWFLHTDPFAFPVAPDIPFFSCSCFYHPKVLIGCFD